MTAKQEKFVLTYLELGNATDAYWAAYNSKAMKPQTVHREASKLLAKGSSKARLRAPDA